MSRIFGFFLLQAVAAQLGDIIPYAIQRESECQGFISTCPPIRASCASIACQQCYNLGDVTFKSCCGAATPAYCFQTAFGSPNDNGGGNPYVTAAATTIDPNLSICQTAVTILSSCESATSNFDDLAGTVQAECLCYDSTTSWDPNGFDLPWSSCAIWASTADVSDYGGFESAIGLCASAGNVLAAVVTTTSVRNVVASTTAQSNTGKTGGGVGLTPTPTPTPTVVGGSTSTPTSNAVQPTTTSSGNMRGRTVNAGALLLAVLSLFVLFL